MTLTPNHKIAFTAPLNYDGGSSGLAYKLASGIAHTMELHAEFGTAKPPRSGRADIEWSWLWPDGEEDCEHIGVWWENGTLVDYDGVFDLPKQAVHLLRRVGIRVGRSFQ